MSGRFPFNCKSNCKYELYEKVLNEPVKMIKTFDEEDRTIIKCLLRKNPKNRVGLKEFIMLLKSFL